MIENHWNSARVSGFEPQFQRLWDPEAMLEIEGVAVL